MVNAIGFRQVQIPENIDTHILSCEFPPTDLTAIQAVLKSDDRKNRLEQELEDLSIQLSEEGGENDDLALRIEEISNEIEGLGSADESAAGSILNGLGFDKEMQTKKTKEFSGGWRMRIALACAL